MTRFVDNLRKTPGGGEVLGVRCRDSAISLAGLVSRQPARGDGAAAAPSHEPSVAADGQDWARFFDLIFVDGGHGADAVLTDALLAYRLLRTAGGVLIFDDYGGGSTETKAGIDAFLITYEGKLEVLHISFIVIVVKK